MSVWKSFRLLVWCKNTLTVSTMNFFSRLVVQDFSLEVVIEEKVLD